MCVGGGGSDSVGFANVTLCVCVCFSGGGGGVKSLNLDNFRGFKKNEYFWGMKIFVDMFGVHIKLYY